MAAFAAAPGPARPTKRVSRQWALAIGAGSIGALATLLLLSVTGMVGTTTQRVVTRRVPAPDDTAHVAALVGPTLVAVHVSSDSGSREGSGVCIRRGYVLTSNDLVGTENAIRLTAADGSTHVGTVVGRDPLTEIALVHMGASGPLAHVAKQSTLRVGEAVIEVSRPTPTGPWVSTGVVSALNRSVAASSGEMMTGLIESDATGAPAGSVIVDHHGAVIGMVTAYSKSNGATLAVPMETVEQIVDDLIAHGRTSHGWLGVSVVDSANGAAIDHIAVGGPAAGTSLRVGDVIAAVDSTPIADMASLLRVVRAHRAHDSIALSVQRTGVETTVTVVLGDYNVEHSAGVAASS